MRIPGVYVEIKGDFSGLQADMKQARQMVAKQATGMSNALNNALSPSQIQSGTMGLVRNLGQVQRSAKVTGKEFDKLGADLGELRRHTGLTEQEFQKLQSRMLQKRATDVTERALKNIQRQAGLTRMELARLQYSMGDTKGAIGTIFKGAFSASNIAAFTAALAGAGYATKEFISTLFNAGLALDNVRTTYKTVFGKNAASEMKFIAKEADRLGQDIEALEKSYVKLAAATKGSIMEGKLTREIFVAVTQAATALKLSADDTAGAINALQQMISKGKVQAEELRGQLGERLPGAFKDAADAMGVTTAALNKMLDDGKVVAEDLLPKLINIWQKKYGPAATEAADSAQAATNRFKNAWVDLKLEMSDSGFMDDMVDAVEDLTEALKDPGVRSALSEIAGGIGQIASGLVTAAEYALKFQNVMLDMKTLSFRGQFTIGNLIEPIQKLLDTYNRTNKITVQIDQNELADALANSTDLGTMDVVKVKYDLGSFENEIVRAADEFGINAKLLAAVIKTESSFNPDAVSKAGALGLTQLMPATAEMLGVDPLNIQDNIRGGAKYLRQLFDQFGDWGLALSAYNAGPGAVQRWGGDPPYKETQAFKKNVYKNLKDYGGSEAELKRRAAVEKEIYEDVGNYRRTIDGQATQNWRTELDKRLDILREKGATEKELMVYEAAYMEAHEKEAADKAVETQKKLNDKLDRLTMDRFNYRRQKAQEDFEERTKEGKNIIVATKILQAELAKIDEEEARSKESSAKRGRAAASSAARSATSTARSHADERKKILEELNLKTIKASGDEYAYKKAMLDKYAADIRAQYAGDKEVLEALDKFYKEKMAEIEGSRSGGGFFGEFGEDLKGMVKNMVSDWASGLNDMLWGAETTFDDILNNFGKMITGMLIQKLLIDRIFESAWFTGLFSAQGSVFSSGGHYVPFRHGDVVSRPTLFPFAEGVGMMGEAGPEAIMPLKRLNNGDLGVQSAGSGGNLEQKIIVNNNAPNTRASASTDGNGNINVLIEQVEGLIQGRMARGTGLAPAMDARYRKRN